MRATPYLPPTPELGENWYKDDPALGRLLAARLPPDVWKEVEGRLLALGTVAPQEVDPLARLADIHQPTLAPDGTVKLDASYSKLQRLAREHRVFTLGWHPVAGRPRGPRLAGLALGYVYAQAECGYFCPACMTDGAAYVLERHSAALAQKYGPRLVQATAEGAYEGAMFLTERTGGSDVGATATDATQAADGSWRLTGDKWFASNANAEVVLTLARMPGGASGTRGLGLFVVPARLPDGRANPGLRRVRLKNKLGVRSMATAEVELRDAYAELVAGENLGFKAMAEMVNLSRLYNAVASVAIARRALREGQRNGAHRLAFGKPLAEQPLYARAVAALGNDVRGALSFVLDTADAFDRAAEGDEEAYRLMRSLTSLAKAETARLAVRAASEACEFLGGNGYCEEWVTPRLLRDAQVLPIWEGTTNVQALDFLRACAKEGAADTIKAHSLRLLSGIGSPEAAALHEAWKAWHDDAMAIRTPPEMEVAALRLLTRAYHLRCATLLAHDARDGNAEAVAHAEAYVERHVRGDEAAFDHLVLAKGDRLAGWPASGVNPTR